MKLGRQTGIIRHLVANGRCGFIQSGDDLDIFVSAKEIDGAHWRLRLGERVEFEIESKAGGKRRLAVNARIVPKT